MSETRVLFLGEKPLALRCLRILASIPGVEIAGVGTRQTGELWWGDNEIVEECRAQGIALVPKSKLGEVRCDLIVSVLYPFIIDGKVIANAARGAFNLHEAPLPRWRGCNGCSHAILAGDADYATTLHEMDAALDAGRVIAERRFPIELGETARELYERTSAHSETLAQEWFPRLVAGDYAARPQTPGVEAHTNARGSLMDRKQVPLMMPVAEALRVARAMDFVPWEPAFVETPAGIFYLYVAGSPGRETPRSRLSLSVTPDARLADLPWGALGRAVIDGAERPLEVCRQSDYLDIYPLHGRSAIGCAA